MPFTTLLLAVKVLASVVVEKLSEPPAESRESKTTSEGEFARVGTWPDGGTVESFGKVR